MYIPLAGLIVRAQSPDALYAQRGNLESARQAARLWAEELRERPETFEAAWKLARICYWLGTHAPESERRGFLEQGIRAAETAKVLEPGRSEGYFWTAANMGGLAESFGLRAGLRYRKPIKEALETVLKIDPAFLNGSADRALGRWYARVPRLFGGSDREAEAHLRASLRYDPDSTLSHLFLGEFLLDEGRRAEARAEFEAVLAAPLSADWGPEDEDNKQQAKERLAKLR